MMKKKFNLGLALGGGSARGLTHIGVLKALEENDIKPDFISGTSAGAIIGALYCSGISVQMMEQLSCAMTRADWVKLLDFSFSRSGMLKGEKLLKFLKKHTGGERDFKDMKPPFTAVATDINTGESVYINQGSLWSAVRASFSIPIIFKVLNLQGRYLVDGGLSEMVPVASCAQMGADFVLAVNCLSFNDNRLFSPQLMTQDKTKTKGKPGLVRIAVHTFEIAVMRIIQDNLLDADFVIEPDTKEIGPTDFKKSKQCIDLGYQTTMAQMEKLKKALAEFDPQTKKNSEKD